MSTEPPTVHASAVQVGDVAVLIRGPSGSGKSRLALQLILAGRARQIPAATLVGDDRVYLDRDGDALVARSVSALAGLIEVRGLGIRRCDSVPSAPVGLVVDLAASDAARLPTRNALQTTLLGITLPRVPVAAGENALLLVLAVLTLPEALTTGE
ncbi:MAG: putative HPr kinase/phosphorylase [Tardiphaga sp.]|nr:putative HPr kinase/phosphorylase [Tardiphaga sp.]MDB5624302.1 putative HPr kinase/phosphorylase [Tardiphaga sp.]